MTIDEFKEMYEKFKPTWKNDISDIKDTWKKYYEKITGEGLPFEDDKDVSWVKSGDQYLPRFIDQMKMFGRARIGNYEQVMIYKNTGDKNGQYFDGYLSKKDKYSTDKTAAEDDYNKEVRGLLSEIVNAETTEDLYKVEKDDGYGNFRAKQFLRKLSVLNSVFNDEAEYKNQLLWIYSDGVINNLVKILNIKSDGWTFFKKSFSIFEEVKGWINVDDLDALCKLNEFLWVLGSQQVNELTNFNSPNVIYHGAPGTGKTYTTLQTVKMICRGDTTRYKYCQFHPSYSYQDFIEGIKPMGIKDGNVNLEVANGVFKQFCIDVKNANEKTYNTLKENYRKYPHYYFIVDEINRGDLSRIFGETFSLLEPDYRDKNFSEQYTQENLITTPLAAVIKASNKKDSLVYKEVGGEPYFGIPFNIHFIGLMNDVDKSIDTFDLALRRRFKWVEKLCDYDVIQDYIENPEVAEKYSEACEKLNKFICDKLGLSKNYQLGQSYFMKINKSVKDKGLKSAKEKVFNNYIYTTLREYAREICDEQEIDEKIKAAKEAFIPETANSNSNNETSDDTGETDDE